MRILAVEDEISLLNSMREYLAGADFMCDGASTYEDGHRKISFNRYDCVLIDITLPDGNGLKLLDHLKSIDHRANVIILSAKNSTDDKVAGLNMGADDYIVKPFHLSELKARIRAVARRKGSGTTENIVSVSNVDLNVDCSQASVDGSLMNLTKKEFSILLYLAENKERVVAKNVLVEHLWGDTVLKDESFNFLFSHIANIKRKLKAASANISIRTAYGWGYQLRITK